MFGYLNSVDPYLFSFFQAFLLTFIAELLILLLLVVNKIPILRIFKAVIIANLVSMPVVWFLISGFIREVYIYLVISELFAIFSESLILKFILSLSYRRSLFCSLIANLFSFSIGWTSSILFLH
jgi:hypothetical protein